MATKKQGENAPAIDFNLDKLEAPEEARAYAFSFKGKRFTTVNPVEVDFEEMERVWSLQDEGAIARATVDLMLGDKAQDFWKLKPSIWAVLGLQKELDAPLKAIFGEPGESNGS